MRCPRCGFDGELVQGGCARCGYGRTPSGPVSTVNHASSRYPQQYALPTTPVVRQALMRGDVLRQGRYRLVEPLLLPENQRVQGTAWLANDTQSALRRVLIREVAFPTGTTTDKEQAMRSLALQQNAFSQHAGFPRVTDVFSEQGNYYIVFQYPEGETLGTLLNRQGGALPERTVAVYGQQLCDMLTYLASMQPPIVHGGISPDTIIVSPDKKHVSLLFVPLFSPKALPTNRSHTSSGYMAPEQARGVIEPSIDLYALAATLLHAVTGYDPRERLAFFHPPARRLNPAVTPAMESILSRALRLSPTQRYTRPPAMLNDLSKLIASYPPEIERTANSVSNPLLLDTARMRRRSSNRNLVSVVAFAGVSILVLLGFLLFYLRPFTSLNAAGNTQATATALALDEAALNKEQALETQTFQKKGIGLSDGRFVLDTYDGRLAAELNLKKQAAQAISQGNMSTAVNLLTKATTEDPTDAEAQIYNEDIHILQDGTPYITIVLGIAFDSSAADYLLARAELQGAYLAQHEINTGNLLPRMKLRLLLDSSGANNDDVATVAQFITNRVLNAGNLNHIIGVIGWPFSSQTINARDIIAAAHLPLVSETASSIKLSGSSPYFFRVNPPDNSQGKTLGTVAVDSQQFNAKTILILRDPTDPYSVSLADAFTASVESLHARAINNAADYFTEGTTTVPNYQKIINDAIKSNANLIFLAGLDTDAVRLAHALGNAYRANPTNSYLANLQILGGDAIDTGLILGQGDGPDAAIARNFPQDIRRLSFTAFGHPDEWPANNRPSFFQEWSSTYQASTIAANNAPPPGNDAILTYDALRVVIDAATLVRGPFTGQAIRDALASIGRNTIPAFQGISGRILFDTQGNPIDKAVVVLTIRRAGGENVVVLLKVAGRFR